MAQRIFYVSILSFCLSAAGAYYLVNQREAACYTVVSDGVFKPVSDDDACVTLIRNVRTTDLSSHIAIYDRTPLISIDYPLSKKTISEFTEHRKLLASSHWWLP